ncbi:MAG: DUF721 domain-containing protein [Planctomycetota bacterium]
MKIGEAVDKYLKKSGYKKLLKHEEIWRKWSEIIGEDIAEQTKISRFSKGVLTIDVNSSALMFEMKSFLSKSVIVKLSEKIKKPIVRINFRLDSGDAHSC